MLQFCLWHKSTEYHRRSRYSGLLPSSWGRETGLATQVFLKRE